MRKDRAMRQRAISLLASFCLFLGGTIAVASAGALAQTASPAADYKINAEHTATSPDGKTTVEQYAKVSSDGDYTWQFWTRRADRLTMLEPEQPDYPAGFRFSNDSRWLIRMQKTGSGEGTLYLYRLAPEGFAAATSTPLGDLAWDYFNSLPDSKKMEAPDFHISADLLKGTDENYRWLGVNWADSRYLVITLSGDVSPNDRHGQLRSVRGWRCRYDLQQGTFDVPAEFSDHNAEAVAPNAQ
jgi:hypothetical protein